MLLYVIVYVFISMKIYPEWIIYHILVTSYQKETILNHVSSIINMDALMDPYCTLILTYLSYCAMVWKNTYTTTLMPFYLKQKKAIRIACNVKNRDHTPVTQYEIINFLPNN